VLTINGRIRLLRRWWHGVQTGSTAPADEVLNRGGATITPGVLELACRENLSATSFEKAAANLARTAQLTLSGEQLRREVEAVGRHVAEAQQTGRIDTAWKAEDCRLKGEAATRVYTGCDGVMVPVITDAEKQKRREAIKAKRRRCGKKCKPLPPRKHGVDQAWKEFKVVYFYSEDMRRQHVAFTHHNHEAAGKLMRREADRLLQYVSARRDMIRYPAFRANGWQIGSGPTESQCKLCTKRLKGHGRRWDRPNASAVAALDTLDRSGQWHKFWPNASPAAV
jgi:hypothetical protein